MPAPFLQLLCDIVKCYLGSRTTHNIDEAKVTKATLSSGHVNSEAGVREGKEKG